MRHLLLGLILVLPVADRAADRDALLAADRALSDKTARQGLVSGFLPALTDDAAFLYPDAPLLRGIERIRAFVHTGDSIRTQAWRPLFADVSADGKLGYTYGWTHDGPARGKYLACWQKSGNTWRLAAYANTRAMPVTDSATTDGSGSALSTPVRGRADPHELIQADSAFAAMSVTSGAKQAFITFAAEDAVAFGGGSDLTRGRQAIGAGFDGFPTGAVLEWWPVSAKVAPSGDLGCTVGEAKITSLNRYSKYLTIWRREFDRTWKFVADGGSSRPAP